MTNKANSKLYKDMYFYDDISLNCIQYENFYRRICRTNKNT